MKKEEYAKWSTEKLLANVKLNKVVKAIIIGLCCILFSCALILVCSGEFSGEIFWLIVCSPIVIALYLWGMFALFNLELKRVKEELKKRQYSKKDEIAADIWLKKFYTAMIILLIVAVVISLGAALIKNNEKTAIPNESSESFSDYIKREDPDLYNDIVDRYNSLK